MPDHRITVSSSDQIQHLENEFSNALARHESISGCFTIIGPVELCWQESGGGFKVCLKLAGVEVACVSVTPDNPCEKIEGNVFCAKASIEVCIEGTCLTYKGQACYKDLPCFGDWKCVDIGGTIVCL